MRQTTTLEEASQGVYALSDAAGDQAEKAVEREPAETGRRSWSLPARGLHSSPNLKVSVRVT